MRFKRQPDDILQSIGIYDPKDIDLDLVSYSLGAEVTRTSLSDCEGSIIGTDTNAIITINEDATPQRQRFSLGHELGHWVNDGRKNLSYRCSSNDMKQFEIRKNDFKQNKEVQANQFSAELIMPHFLFYPYIDTADITFETVKNLANTFQVSVTSSAIRLVELNTKPCMLISWSKDGTRRWFNRNNIVPENIWPHKKIMHPQDNFKIIDKHEVDSDKWIDQDDANDHVVIESIFSTGYDFLTLLWWSDETQLIK